MMTTTYTTHGTTTGTTADGIAGLGTTGHGIHLGIMEGGTTEDGITAVGITAGIAHGAERPSSQAGTDGEQLITTVALAGAPLQAMLRRRGTQEREQVPAQGATLTPQAVAAQAVNEVLLTAAAGRAAVLLALTAVADAPAEVRSVGAAEEVASAAAAVAAEASVVADAGRS